MKKRIGLIIMAIFLLTGCASQTAQKTLKTPTVLTFFSIEICSACKAFKKEAIPYLEDMYGDSLTIQIYDLEDSATKPIYDNVINSLVDFNQEQYGMGPFYAVEGYFAKAGYTPGDEVELAKDIEKAVNGQELGYELEAYRYLYK